MIDAFFLALAFGTVWFYAASVVFFFLIMLLSETEHNIFATLSLIVFVFLMENSGAFNIFSDPLILLKWTLLYFIVGVVWSFLKWISFLHKRADRYVELKREYLENRPKDIPMVTKENGVITPTKEFKDFLENFSFLSMYGNASKTIVPMVTDHKEKITTWIIWWPTSAVWTILSDPMVRIANWIFDKLRGLYQVLANRAFADKFN